MTVPYVLKWFITSLAESVYSGTNFDHNIVQIYLGFKN